MLCINVVAQQCIQCTCLFFSANSILQSSVPAITFYPSVIPTTDNIRFCCVTENIHRATIHFYRETDDIVRETDDIVTINYPCHIDNKLTVFYNVTCQSEGPRTTMFLNVKRFQLQQTDSHIFGCRYYGKSAQYTLFSSQGRLISVMYFTI